ncbi:MAG: OmpA family protein [Deltaproteobacteria bacterium]|jgi:outer membrane protein OmpA-like peptidoglycan-associated protein
MRPNSATSHVVTFLAACALLFLAPLAALPGALPRAAAQSEFDDEFDDDAEAQRPPARGRTGASGRDSGRGRSSISDDLEAEDEFEGGGSPRAAREEDAEESRPAEAQAEREPAPAPPEGRVTDARGDLLSASGSRAWRQRRFVLHNTYNGTVGGLHVADAGSGPSQTFRVQLLTDFFIQSGFLRTPGSDPMISDENRHIGGALSLSYTPFDFLEIYGSIRSYANSNDTESPGLFQVLGDSTFGLKGYYEVLPWLVLGGDFGVHFLNTVGDIGLVLDSTSLNFRFNASADFRALEGVEIPLIARFNLSYFYDRSAVLTDAVERARYDALPTTGPDARRPGRTPDGTMTAPCYTEGYNCEEDRHLLTRAERFALNINRTDFVDIALGFEAPILVMENFYVSPIAEWVVQAPVNSRGYVCLVVPSERDLVARGVVDGCMSDAGFDAVPSTLTLGVRVQPPVRGFGILLAVDIATSGQRFVRELAGNAPYNVYFGLSYAVDTVPPPAEVIEREVERTVEVRIPPPVRGRILGTVVERGTTTGIGGAVVSFPGTQLTALSTGSDGRFATYELAPGQVRFSIAHPDYRAGECAGTVPEAGGDVNVSCSLEALPRVGSVRGRVVGDGGQPVAGASVNVTGPQAFTALTDPNGGFARQNLPPGNYQARIESDAYLITTSSFEVRARETAEPAITVVARPTRSQVQLRDRELTIRRQINFATDSAEILPDSIPLMTEIADTLMRHPEISGIEIQGHTDNRGGSERNMTLSQERADAVRQWLVTAGVAADRLTARGYGDTRPIGPNITAGGRARNRRVQFIITSRAE